MKSRLSPARIAAFLLASGLYPSQLLLVSAFLHDGASRVAFVRRRDVPEKYGDSKRKTKSPSSVRLDSSNVQDQQSSQSTSKEERSDDIYSANRIRSFSIIAHIDHGASG
jgi:hypothetical protein